MISELLRNSDCGLRNARFKRLAFMSGDSKNERQKTNNESQKTKNQQ
jgi:hypothetical protein